MYMTPLKLTQVVGTELLKTLVYYGKLRLCLIAITYPNISTTIQKINVKILKKNDTLQMHCNICIVKRKKPTWKTGIARSI